MKKTSFTSVVTMALALVAGQAVQAQSAYFQAVTNLNPIGYWPLNETAQPPAPFSFSLTASNSGSLGAVGNGYYGAWYQPSGNTWFLTNNIVKTNGIAGAGDAALWCQKVAGQYVVVPRTIGGVPNPNVTLTPPFTLEAWVVPTTLTSGTYGIIGEGGAFVNYGGPNTNNPYYGGGGTGYAGVVMGQFATGFLFDCFATNGTSKANELDGPTNATRFGQWNHLVCTYDGTTENMWINNVLAAHKTTPKNAAGVTFTPDLLTPLMIGSGPEVTAQSGEGGIGFDGAIDEVAVYNTVLPQSSINAHFNAATNANYPNAVLSDNPVLYFRFNDTVPATNAGYPSSTFPVATNYGTLGTNANGVYQPGTTPGVAGPSYVGFGSNAAVALNGWLGAVDVGFGNIASNCPALNPVGKVPFTVVSWFQGNSADAPGRYQDIVGHGNNSYRLALGTTCGENRWNPATTELQFLNPTDMITNHAADNDGNWHMTAGVTDGTNAYMYLDGILYKSTNSITGISIPGSSIDLLLGGDPQNSFASFNTANTDRTFDGQIAQVAIWNSALTTAQIQSMFNAAGVPPSIVTQPVGVTNNQGANVTITTGVAGSQPISYQWYTNGTAVTGQTNQSLIYPNILAGSSGSYNLVATSSYGSATSAVVSVQIFGSPVIISQTQPDVELYAGRSPVLSVTALGAPPIIYQWYSNSVPIASATNSSYTVANAQSSATYTFSLTNYASSGLVTGTPITLTILPDPTAPYPVAVLADNPLAFWRLDESMGATAYDVVGGNNGIYTNTYLAFDSAYHPNSDPTEGGAPGFGVATTNNSYVGWVPTNVNFAAPTNVNAEFSVECWLQEFLNPQGVTPGNGIISIGYGNGGEEFALDCGASASFALRFYVRTAGGNSIPANSTFVPTTDGAWHHVVGVCDEAGGHLFLYVDGTNVGTGTIPVKSGILTSTQPLTIGARQEGLNSQYDFQYIGAIDEVAVYNYALTPAQVQAHYFASGIQPVISQITPANQTVNLGSSATFTATVAGSPPLSYQWYDPNNSPISTNSTLVISNVQAGSAGQYTLVVTNSYGTANGSANLQVNLGPPTLVQDISPATQTVVLYSGLDTISYSIVVAGSAPFSYQWYQDGTSISGATNSSYTFTALPGTNTYYVTVTNVNTATQGGGVPLTSGTATVIGLGAPQLNPANYSSRVKISFPGYNGHPLTNFPALITLSPATVPGLDYSQFQAGGSDLRFTDASGTAMLPYEIDEWNDAGLSTIWVQLPILNGTNIWAYWGNPANTDVPPASSNVWSQAGYEIVYHLKESALPFADSTGTYPATNGVAPIPTNGVVGHGGAFDGTDYLTPGQVTLSNQFTTYAWIYLNPSDTDIQTIWANQVGGFGANGISWFVDSYQTADRITHFDSGIGGGSGTDPTGTSPTSTGQWHFMTATWDQVAAKATNYLDAVVNGSGAAAATFSLTNQLDLGSFLNSAFLFHGSMDEARVQYGIASTNWITTTFLNMAQGSFVSYTSVNLEPMLSIASATNGYVLTWPANDGTFTLETTASLSHPEVWTSVTNPPAILTNGMWQQVVQPAAGSHFYRLQGQ